MKLIQHIFISVFTASFTITLETMESLQNISSPNYPRDYPNHIDITFIIHSPEKSHVKLSFFDLSIQEVFRLDHLIIFDGKLFQSYIGK